ncbi:hypothetical protein BH11BAC6_BH11BAC6_01080 [soil metagenome]
MAKLIIPFYGSLLTSNERMQVIAALAAQSSLYCLSLFHILNCQTNAFTVKQKIIMKMCNYNVTGFIDLSKRFIFF